MSRTTIHLGGCIRLVCLLAALALTQALFAASRTRPTSASKPAPASKPASQPASAPAYSVWPFDANEAARRQDETARAVGIPKDLKLKIDANVSLKLVLIPAGKFSMGSPATEKERADGETQHEVTIRAAFYMGVYHVTQEQYQRVMGKNPSYFKGAANPVDKASWEEAMEFCKALSKKTGRTVALPTEAQWEYACRAGTATPFSTGETISTEQANYNGAEIYGDGNYGESQDKTTPVGGFKPNAFGLYDMHGNAWQWCADWYDENYYASSPPADPEGPKTGESHVLRGGSWFDGPGLCRSASRILFEPVVRVGDHGFRVVVTDLKHP
jgi:formylglycine-generating enzyme required for sulfatase activity